MTLALAALAIQRLNTLTPDERAAGWRLLFDGRTTRGWHNFKASGVGSGWRVVDGALTCADPHTAGGDLVTADRYDWFELRLEYRLAPGSNSGVLFHVADTGDATWQSGPEIQLHDRVQSDERQKSGWLYGLYPTATNVAREGEWNRLRLVLTPGGCSTELNDVPYVTFQLGSEDFKRKVAESKFGTMPEFAKLDRGAIALQGDHGVVAFRNVKLRPLPAKL